MPTLLFMLGSSGYLLVWATAQLRGGPAAMPLPLSPMFFIGAAVVVFYFQVGIYACVWKIFCGQRRALATLNEQAKRYVSVVFITMVCLALIRVVVVRMPVLLCQRVLFTGMPLTVCSMQFDASLLIRGGLELLLDIAFVYMMPYIFVFDRRSGPILRHALAFLRGHMAESRPLIVLLLLALAIKTTGSVLLANLAREAPVYWPVLLMQTALGSYITLIIFLTGSQILVAARTAPET